MTYTVRPVDKAQDKAIKAVLDALKVPYEKTEEKSPYNPEFVEKINKSEENFREGRYKIIKTADLWK